MKPMVGSGLIGGEKYLVANIIFKFALGGEFLNGFTDEVAVKVISANVDILSNC